MKNNNEVVLKVTNGIIRMYSENIHTMSNINLKSPKDVYKEFGGPDKYRSLYSRNKSFRRRG